MHVYICFSFVPFLAVSSLIRHAIQLNIINLGISPVAVVVPRRPCSQKQQLSQSVLQLDLLDWLQSSPYFSTMCMHHYRHTYCVSGTLSWVFLGLVLFLLGFIIPPSDGQFLINGINSMGGTSH
ncbi:hypothetical protein NC651_025261 [Populus alba x Populus x berolinensis]|nr:hypothetical protein NC651_025261 [Populus alba x Populus x berolinensis]